MVLKVITWYKSLLFGNCTLILMDPREKCGGCGEELNKGGAFINYRHSFTHVACLGRLREHLLNLHA